MFNRPKPGVLVPASDSESQAREKISILCPTRNRVDNIEKFVTSVYETAEFKDLLEFIFYIDDDDENSVLKCEELSNNNIYSIKVVIGERIIMSSMWNKCFEESTGEIMFIGADDIIFRTENWDSIVRNEFDKFDDKIALIYGSDGIKSSKKNHGYGNHFFIHRNWEEVLGYVDPPYFSSDYADLWMADVAQRIDRKIWINIDTEHMHPGVGKN